MATITPEVTGRKRRTRSTKKPRSDRFVYSVVEAGQLLGLGRNAAYAAAARGDIPTLRMGRLLLVPKIPFHRMLGMTGSLTTTPAEMTDACAKIIPAGLKEENV